MNPPLEEWMNLQEEYNLKRVEMGARHKGQLDKFWLQFLQVKCSQPSAMSLELVKQTGQTCVSLSELILAGEFPIELMICEAEDLKVVKSWNFDEAASCWISDKGGLCGTICSYRPVGVDSAFKHPKRWLPKAACRTMLPKTHIPRSCLPSSIFGIWTPSKFKYDELIKLIPSGATPLTHILQLGSSLFWDSFRQKKELTICCQQTHKTLQLNEKLLWSWLSWKCLIWLSELL